MSASHSSEAGGASDDRVANDPTGPFGQVDEDDDDDGDFYPGEGDTDEDDDDEEEENRDDYHDAAESFGNGVEIEVEFGEASQGTGGTDEEDEEEEEEEEENGGEGAGGERRPIYLTREQIMQLLGHTGLGRLFATGLPGGRRRAHFSDHSESESESEDEISDPRQPKRQRLRGRKAFEKVPSEEGQALMNSGTFGSSFRRRGTVRTRKRLQHKVLRREMGLGSEGQQKNANRLIKQDLIPQSMADTIIHYNARCYSGQFSNDGNFFFSCAQDFRVRMYDTSNPYDWKYYKSVVYPYGQWTITDASLSPDNRFLAYSSIRPIVCLADTDPESDNEPHLLDLASTGNTSPSMFASRFGVWSIRFSGDGRELVAGTGDCSVYVYDIERGETILRIQGHDDDVNAVCYGDAHSPHILYSGSDDTTVKVWDRRSMGDGREAGVFYGHTEGLTYVDSKGDGRYVLSNAKDQTAKLWDLRKMMSKEKADRVDAHRYTTHFEYRSSAPYPVKHFVPHPHDCSLVTFRGHQVLQTLIRCHFSPPGSTDSRYVYSGSHDGSVYIWNLDATLAGKVDVQKATENSRPREGGVLAETYDYFGRSSNEWKACVRDASWHPNAPVIAATSWNGWGASQGTCTVHTWNDGLDEDEAEPKMGRRVNAKLMHDERLYRSSAGRPRRFYNEWFADDDDDDEEVVSGEDESEHDEFVF